jgi:hypothetical protein
VKNKFWLVTLVIPLLVFTVLPATATSPFFRLRNDPEETKKETELDSGVTQAEPTDTSSIRPNTGPLHLAPDTSVNVGEKTNFKSDTQDIKSAEQPGEAETAGETQPQPKEKETRPVDLDRKPEKEPEETGVKKTEPEKASSKDEGKLWVEEPRPEVPTLPAPIAPLASKSLEPINSKLLPAQEPPGDTDLFTARLMSPSALSGPGSPPGWPWLKIILFLCAGGGFLFLFWWLRRPRKVKVFQQSSVASKNNNEYYRQFMDKYSRVNSTISVPGSRIFSSTKPKQKTKSRSVWNYSPRQLERLNIDPKYREVFKLYYAEGYDIKRIAEETGFGIGEIGLVLDLTRRQRRSAS